MTDRALDLPDTDAPVGADTSRPDEQLMQAYVAGDPAAFDLLYARHEGALYRFVRRLLGSTLPAQADEVFQDCWLRIVQARERFDPALGRWRTWAFGIAYNLAMDRLRTSGRERSVDGGADDAGDSDDAGSCPVSLEWLQAERDLTDPSAEDLAYWRAAGRQLLTCLDALPAAQRAAFLLHHEDGLSLDDLARSLDLGFETIKSRLRYALTKLRTCMGSYLDPREGTA